MNEGNIFLALYVYRYIVSAGSHIDVQYIITHINIYFLKGYTPTYTTTIRHGMNGTCDKCFVWSFCGARMFIDVYAQTQAHMGYVRWLAHWGCVCVLKFSTDIASVMVV